VEEELLYNPELALRILAERIAQLEYEKAIIGASQAYYKALAEQQGPTDNLTEHEPIST
jgi:hypothetical protein